MIRFTDLLLEGHRKTSREDLAQLIHKRWYKKWYHGTSSKSFEKIRSTGFVKPFMADVRDYGKAIWFDNDLDLALESYQVVLQIDVASILKFHFYFESSELRSGLMVVFDPIPLKYFKIIDNTKRIQ